MFFDNFHFLHQIINSAQSNQSVSKFANYQFIANSIYEIKNNDAMETDNEGNNNCCRTCIGHIKSLKHEIRGIIRDEINGLKSELIHLLKSGNENIKNIGDGSTIEFPNEEENKYFESSKIDNTKMFKTYPDVNANINNDLANERLGDLDCKSGQHGFDQIHDKLVVEETKDCNSEISNSLFTIENLSDFFPQPEISISKPEKQSLTTFKYKNDRYDLNVNYEVQDCKCCKDYFGIENEERIKSIGRHKSNFKRPNTPPKYWDVDF